MVDVANRLVALQGWGVEGEGGGRVGGQQHKVLICRQTVCWPALSSFRTIYLNIDDKVSPPGLWRDTLTLRADVQRHGRLGGAGREGEGQH